MEQNFIKLLKPKNIHQTKRRIGPPEDGGYVMTEEVMKECSALMTYGVGHDTRYEEEFVRTYNKPAFLFDHTNGMEKWERDNMKFIPEGLGYNEKCKEWHEHYMEMGIKGDIFLKIDIEEYEYEYFKRTDIKKMASYVKGMLLEVHWIDSNSNREKLVEILNKIEEHFSLIHLHGNNWGGLWEYEGLTIPKVLELSFVNKNFINSEEYDTQDYPIVGLDLPNKPDAEDYKLDFIKHA